MVIRDPAGVNVADRWSNRFCPYPGRSDRYGQTSAEVIVGGIRAAKRRRSHEHRRTKHYPLLRGLLVKQVAETAANPDTSLGLSW